jgi:hypothetical protein
MSISCIVCLYMCIACSPHGVQSRADSSIGAAVALELQRADGPVSIWRDAHPASPAQPAVPTSPSSPTAKYANRIYLHVGAEGLFPRPMHAEDAELPIVCQRMRLLGRLIAKALRDGFNVPLPLSPAFFGAGARVCGRQRTCWVGCGGAAHVPGRGSAGTCCPALPICVVWCERWGWFGLV